MKRLAKNRQRASSLVVAKAKSKKRVRSSARSRLVRGAVTTLSSEDKALAPRYSSPYRAPHESFRQPADGNVKVWRYLDLARLISLLMSKQFLLTRVDKFADDFEGSVTRGVYETWQKSPKNAAIMAKMRPELKRQIYASCWRADDDESEAMWRLYCGDREGVALCTTYAKLDKSLSDYKGLWLGEVSYVDYEMAEKTPADINGRASTPFE